MIQFESYPRFLYIGTERKIKVHIYMYIYISIQSYGQCHGSGLLNFKV